MRISRDTEEVRQDTAIEGGTDGSDNGRDPTRGNARQVVKVTVNLPLAIYSALVWLAETRGVTMTEALRHAISTERFLEEAMAKGDQLLLKNEKDSTVREVIFHR